MRIGIDIGGTFTDFVLFDEAEGTFRTYKILSTPEDPSRAVLDGMQILGGGRGAEVVHGSTVATNAVLERRGACTALVMTEGFADVLAIGRQTRSELYDFFSDRPTPLVPARLRFEVRERVDAHGDVIEALQVDEIPPLVQALEERQVEAVALCLLFSFLHPQHEQQIAHELRAAGFFVSPSSEVLPEFREYERASTTVINAYVTPVLDRYLGRMQAQLESASLHVMQSNGGSISAKQARKRAVGSILSGPAGGVVGARAVARAAGFERLISFDMGGTSTDVSLCQGEIAVTTEAEIDGLPIRIPVIDIHTVGSGGGSIAYSDPGGALRVGPRSAGAQPGPACYAQGGAEATVTDANLVLGRLAADQFLGGRMALDAGAAHQALERLALALDMQAEAGLDGAQRAALGVIQVANAHMERALRVISVERGHDPADFVLLSFGGAGGLHAVDLARALGIRQVLVPPGASTLSAFGMLAADIQRDYVRTVMLPGTTPLQDLLTRMQELERQGSLELGREGVAQDELQLSPQMDLRYQGQAYELTLPLQANFLPAFHQLHARTYGHSAPDAPVEIVNLRLQAKGHVAKPPMQISELAGADPCAALFDQRPVVLAEGLVQKVNFYQGARLRPGNEVQGPAVIVHSDTTVFLTLQDVGRVDPYGNFLIRVGGAYA